MTIAELFEKMPSHFVTGVLDATKTYYFSLGEEKYTVTMGRDGVTVAKGRTVENADVVLKATPQLFLDMVLHGKMPGAWDIAKGAIKTNDPAALMDLAKAFRWS